MIEREEVRIPSSDGIHLLQGSLYKPQGEAKGIFQVIHGMTDYTQRYDSLLCEMAREGYVSFGFDLLGHGKTARDASEYGFFAKKNGADLLIRDVFVTANWAKKRYGEKLPFVLMGHSMGSFIARCAVKQGLHVDRLILVGSSGPNHSAPFGIALCDILSKLYGEKHISHWMQGLIFQDYDSRFPGDYPKRWITVDTENLIRYKDDPCCTFLFTVSALSDLIRLNVRANDRKFFRSVPAEMPILLLSGKEDPVGAYGKGVEKVAARLRRKGKCVSLRLYDGYRHEILQDFCRDEVISDIKSFVNQ